MNVDLPYPFDQYSGDLRCELCNEPATEHDYSYPAQMVVCPQCIEDMLDARTDAPRAEVGLVVSRGGWS